MSLFTTINNDPNLVAYVRHNETAGATSLYDTKRQASYAISGGITLGTADDFVIGDSSTAGAYNGTSGHATIPHTSVLNFDRLNPFTILAVINPNVLRSGGNLDYWIYCKALDVGTFRGLLFGLRWVGSGCRLQVSFISTYPTQAIHWVSRYDIQNTTSTLCGVTYDGSATAAGLKLWINSQQCDVYDDTNGGWSQSLTTTTVTTDDAFIGVRGSLGKHLKANVKDLAIFNAVKSAEWQRLLVQEARPFTLTTPLVSPRPQIFLDTDIDSDIDDVVDLAFILGLERARECDIIGVCVSSANTKAAPTLYTIANYYGRGDLKVGAYTAAEGNSTSSYNVIMAVVYGVPGYTDASNFENGVTATYRRELAAAVDGSVTIITTGGLTALSALLQTAGDGYSALSGANLVAAKVNRIIICAGYWPNGPSISDAGTSKTNFEYILNNCPVPILLCGIEIGNGILTGGGGVMTNLAADNMARHAWVTYWANALSTNSRPGWAQLAILAGVRGIDGLFFPLAADGDATINTTTGITSWATTPDNNHSVLAKQASDTTFVSIVNDIVAAEPPDYVVLGPTTGTSGVASGTFTLRKASTAFSGSQAITLTATRGTTITVTATGTISGNGTATVTVTPANLQTGFTFTMTAVDGGRRTIAFTNDFSADNPAVVSFTASGTRRILRAA